MIERILKFIEAFECYSRAIAVEFPVTLIESFLGMHLVIEVAHSSKQTACLLKIRHSVAVAVLLEHHKS